jgi:hypothetical protein
MKIHGIREEKRRKGRGKEEGAGRKEEVRRRGKIGEGEGRGKGREWGKEINIFQVCLGIVIGKYLRILQTWKDLIHSFHQIGTVIVT